MRCSSLLRLLEGGGAEARLALRQTYGSEAPAAVEERRQAWVRVVRCFLSHWRDREVVAFRAPARIALNAHCEHQGAWVPYGTHRRELICIAGARPDDVVTLTNLDPAYQSPLSFRLRNEMAVAPDAWRRGWVDYIEHPEVTRPREALADPKDRRHGRTGSINFIKATALRLAMEASAPLGGADMVIEGDIPIGVGQSSSSALVVAAALTFDRLWGLRLDPERMAALCGEAEWYVGTRGGAGDHAAMLLGSCSGLVGVRFVPPVTVRDKRPMCLPPGYRILIANSSHKAIKNKEERRQFNAGIFAYRFALLYLRDAVAEHGRKLGVAAAESEIRFLADVSVERFPLQAIYQLLLAVPETVSPRELMARHPESYEASAMTCFGTADCHQLPERIPVRGAALYGLGRVDRGLAMHALCARGDEAAMAEFGRLMYVTHDGDRVSRYSLEKQSYLPYLSNRESVSNSRLLRLIAAASAGPGSPGWEGVQLRQQSGYYGASVPELDRIVDSVSPLPEVLGAGLMGAGGGGCVLILARDDGDTLGKVTDALERHYFGPLRKPVEVEPWVPVAPAGAMDFQAPSRSDVASPEGRQQRTGTPTRDPQAM